MRLDELGQPVIGLFPDLTRHDRLEWGVRQLEREVESPTVTRVYDRWEPGRLGSRAADQPLSDLLNRLHRSGEPDALHRSTRDVCQPLQGECQVCPTTRFNHSVDLVYDHRANGPEHLPAPLRGQQKIEGLRSGDENVGWLLQHGGTFGGRRVARADGGGDARRLDPALFCQPPDLSARLCQIQMDVRAQRFERRDVDHPGLVGKGSIQTFPEELVQRVQECRQGLSGPGRSGNQRMLSVPNGLPPPALRRGWLAKSALEPAGYNGMERG